MISIVDRVQFTVANATTDLDEFVLASVFENRMWNFVAVADGSNICSVGFEPPGRDPI